MLGPWIKASDAWVGASDLRELSGPKAHLQRADVKLIDWVAVKELKLLTIIWNMDIQKIYWFLYRK